MVTVNILCFNMSLFCCSEKLQTHSIWTFSLFLKNKWIQASLHFLQKCTLVALYIIKASFSGEACCFNISNDDIFPFFVLGTGKSLTTFTISGSVLAAAARSRHVCCICSVVCILACSASRWASGVFGAAVNTELMYALLHSLHWPGSLIWQIYPTNICLKVNDSQQMCYFVWKEPRDSLSLVQIQNRKLNRHLDAAAGCISEIVKLPLKLNKVAVEPFCTTQH